MFCRWNAKTKISYDFMQYNKIYKISYIYAI